MKKRKFYGGGGTDAENAEGADKAASDARRQGFSVEPQPRVKGNIGFLSRLLMGNIDQPGSEANIRFGAGRTPPEDIRNLKGAARAAAESRRQGFSTEPPPPVKDDVGFFKRLMMGNVDQPGSEANTQFRARQKADEDAQYRYAKGGKVSSASKRGDGIAKRGKTKGKML